MRIPLCLAAAFAGVLAFASPVLAAEQAPFTQAALAKAQAADKPIVLHVRASWCTVCAAQNPIVDALLKEPKFKNLVVLDVDFDKQKAEVRKLDVREQSTFVVYKGDHEVARSTGDTSKASIASLFGKATS